MVPVKRARKRTSSTVPYALVLLQSGIVPVTDLLRAAVYLRPSRTFGSSDDHALSDLKRLATERDWTVVATFHDRASLLSTATHHQFDVLVVSSLDQLGDSLRQVVQTVHQLRSHGVHLYFCEQDLDTTGDIDVRRAKESNRGAVRAMSPG